MLSVLVALHVVGSVTVEVRSLQGLNVSDQAALVHVLSSAVERVTGAPPHAGERVALEVDARRVGSRIHVEAARRDGAALIGRASADLTRDTGSWPAPMSDLVADLLPEGKSLTAPSSATPAADASPLALPVAAPARPAPDVADPLVVAAPAGGRSRTIPWIVVGASTAVGVVGAIFAVKAGNDLGATMSSPRLLDPGAIEAQQRAVFEGALLGSVLLSAAASGLVTGVVLLVSD